MRTDQTRMTVLRNWLDLLATLVVVVAGGLMIANYINGGKASTQAGRPAVAALPVPKDPVSLKGAPIDGNAAAKVAIVEFSDFECPFCGKFAREIFPTLEAAYVKPGRVQVAFREFPLAIHAHAARAALAGACAADQNRFWEMHNKLFEIPLALDDDGLAKHAADVGLDDQKFMACMQAASNRVKDDSDFGNQLGVKGTPTFFVGTVRPDGKVQVDSVISGAQPVDQFRAALDRAIAKS